jgi:hypothetical protein
VEAQKAFLLNNAELAAKLAGAIADQNRKMREAGK